MQGRTHRGEGEGLPFYPDDSNKLFSNKQKNKKDRTTYYAEIVCFPEPKFKEQVLTLPAPCVSENCIEIKINSSFYFHSS